MVELMCHLDNGSEATSITGQPTGAVIATISDLVEQIQAGNIYAEAHDRQFPTGVIRDQLQQCRNFHDYNDDDDDD